MQPEVVARVTISLAMDRRKLDAESVPKSVALRFLAFLHDLRYTCDCLRATRIVRVKIARSLGLLSPVCAVSDGRE